MDEELRCVSKCLLHSTVRKEKKRSVLLDVFSLDVIECSVLSLPSIFPQNNNIYELNCDWSMLPSAVSTESLLLSVESV